VSAAPQVTGVDDLTERALMVMVTVPACSPGVTRAQQMRLPGWRPVTT